jgi:hypothetical protein
MKQSFEAENFVDAEGLPRGGWARGVGIAIEWQSGPLGRGEDRKPPNGAFVEGVIAVAKQRLEHYQASRFFSTENQAAIEHLTLALGHLDKRTAEREGRGVEGTLEV